MLKTAIRGVSIKGIASAVPAFREDLMTSSGNGITLEEATKLANSTGVYARHLVNEQICSSDLCYQASVRLLDLMNIDVSTIDILLFVSQTPDYILPATSATLHKRLGCPKKTASFDINLGCSGYVYGIWIAASLLLANQLNRALLLVGDTISKLVSPQDKSTARLFGDAGSATLIESASEASDITFCLGTDGSGKDNLIVPAGGFRYRHSQDSNKRILREDGGIRSDEDLFMNGPEIFTFTLREVPSMIHELVDDFNVVDAVLFHQANKLILDYLSKKLKIPNEKVPLSLNEFGNTSSASIPVTIVHKLRSRLIKDTLDLIIAGFGVGYSWAACRTKLGPITIPEMIFL